MSDTKKKTTPRKKAADRMPTRHVSTLVKLPSTGYNNGNAYNGWVSGGTFELKKQNGKIEVWGPCGEKQATFTPAALKKAVEMVNEEVTVSTKNKE